MVSENRLLDIYNKLSSLTVAVSGTVPVSGTFYQATQPVSLSTLPLAANAAQDGTDGTGITPPTGAVGIRGWLSGIYNLLTFTALSQTSNSGVITQTSVATDFTLIAANPARKGLRIQIPNNAIGNLTINYGTAAWSGTAYTGITIYPGWFYVEDRPSGQTIHYAVSSSLTFFIQELQ